VTVSSVLVTGAAGGLGAAVVERFVAGGWQVYAADLAAPRAGAGVVPLVMDVTCQESVDAAFEHVDPAQLAAVVNFAGVLGVGPLMEVPAEKLQRILDINVLGTHRVNRAAFRLLRAGGGRIINISSETGWQRALPMNGPYAMSKHAVEAYSDALRRELMLVGVPVVVIQPGPFRTSMTADLGPVLRATVADDSPFAKLARRTARGAARESAKAHDPAELAEVVWTAGTVARPRARYAVGTDPMRRLLHHLPVPLTDRLLRRVLG
jgi:NAD(P)-dependent dehydrogenase (short-subunit alcohol dehydrogenase family)